jgi:hypothetical protein
VRRHQFYQNLTRRPAVGLIVRLLETARETSVLV